MVAEEPRRGRATRQASYKNLFSKNSAFAGDQDGSSVLSMGEDSGLAGTAGRNLNGRAIQASSLAQPGLAVSRSQHNFQYLISQEEDPSAF